MPRMETLQLQGRHKDEANGTGTKWQHRNRYYTPQFGIPPGNPGTNALHNACRTWSVPSVVPFSSKTLRYEVVSFVSAKLKERLARMPDELGLSFFILFVNWLQTAFISLHLELWLANLEKFLLHHCHCQPWVQQSTPDQYDQRKFRGEKLPCYGLLECQGKS